MAQFSKVLIQDVLLKCECKDIVHPWNNSCFHATLQMAMSTLKGSFCYFGILHLIQNLARFKNKKKINRWQMLIDFMKSISFGLTYSVSFVLLNCFFKRLMGRFDYQIITLVVPLLNGLSIFCDAPQRREISASSYITIVFEVFYKKLILNNFILRSKRFETILFMVTNAFLMYFLRKRQELNGKSDNVWFLVPSPLKSEEHQQNINSKNSKKICSHENSCINDIMKDTAKYALIGLIMSGIRFIVFQQMSPVKTNESFFQGRNFQIPLFISSYVFIYKALNCYLCKRRGKDCLKQTFLCGLLSGFSYWFNPNLTILFTALTVLVKISGNHIRENYKVPNLPYIELCFIFINAFLMQTAVLDGKAVPSLFYNMISMATEKKSMFIINAMRAFLQPIAISNNN